MELLKLIIELILYSLALGFYFIFILLCLALVGLLLFVAIFGKNGENNEVNDSR